MGAYLSCQASAEVWPSCNIAPTTTTLAAQVGSFDSCRRKGRGPTVVRHDPFMYRSLSAGRRVRHVLSVWPFHAT